MDPALESGIVSGAVALAIWYGTTRNNRRAQTATDALTARQVGVAEQQSEFVILQGSIKDLEGRLGRVEGDLAHEQDQRRLSNAYARMLAQVLRENDMPVPQPPAGLDLS